MPWLNRSFVALQVSATLFFCLSLMTPSATGIALSASTRKEQEDYLRRFAYMGSSSPDPRLSSLTNPDDVFRRAVRKFQRMARINETGLVDAETKKKMEMPRCGVPDEVGMTSAVRRRRRYATQGSKWWKTSLTYRINNYTPDLSRETTASELRTAFKTWSDVSPLTFTEVTSKYDKVDIDILFGRGNHGDDAHFDGPSGVLAHAFFPQFGGDVHFDEDERWTSKSYSGTNLLQVAIHELGHSLGLSHSDVEASIMAPFYASYDPNIKLHSDDIAGIRYLYGSGRDFPVTQSPRQTTRTTPRHSTPPEICSDPTIDAIFAIKSDVYVFKGDHYYVLDTYGILPGYPKKISDNWPGLPNNIDTAVYWKPETFPERLPGYVYFFKDDKYWRFDSLGQPQRGNPLLISSRFPGLPRNLDAAFVWSGNGKLYFIKGNSYYRYNGGEGIGSDYPRSMGVWKGLPSKIDAAFQYTNDRTYFFSGTDYYRLNDPKIEVDKGYPKSTADAWFGCPDGVVVQPAGAPRRNNPETNSREQFMTAAGGQLPTAFGLIGVAAILVSLLSY